MDSRLIDVRVKGDSMWPTLENGSIVRFLRIDLNQLKPNLVVLSEHPLKKDFFIIKRISSIDNDKAFLIGDNPDPNASEDSHNFGRVDVRNIIAMMIED